MIQKGVLLAGGSGTRLQPLTCITSKQLLPVYDKPLIWFPLQTLLSMGISDILIITTPAHAEDFLQFLGSGKEFGARFEYKIQDSPSGIAHGLSLAENFCHHENLALILGDNIFFDNLEKSAINFSSGAQIFVKEVPDPERFGVAEIQNNTVLSLEEKPQNPRSSLAQTGLYFYDSTVFEKIKTLTPSERGELEITDLNNLYLQENNLHAQILEEEWIDAGTFESLYQAATFVRNMKQKNL